MAISAAAVSGADRNNLAVAEVAILRVGVTEVAVALIRELRPRVDGLDGRSRPLCERSQSQGYERFLSI